MNDQQDASIAAQASGARSTGAERKNFNEDYLIFREGESGDMAFVILEGRVQITKQTEKGPIVLSILEKGGMFGEMALIDNKHRMASARAFGGPVETLVITRRMFEQKLQGLDPFTRGLIEILSANTRSAADK